MLLSYLPLPLILKLHNFHQAHGTCVPKCLRAHLFLHNSLFMSSRGSIGSTFNSGSYLAASWNLLLLERYFFQLLLPEDNFFIFSFKDYHYWLSLISEALAERKRTYMHKHKREHIIHIQAKTSKMSDQREAQLNNVSKYTSWYHLRIPFTNTIYEYHLRIPFTNTIYEYHSFSEALAERAAWS